MDKNENSSFSSVLMIETKQDSASSIAVYPNPVTGSSYKISLKNIPTGNYTLKVTDQSGRVFSIQQINYQSINSEISVEKNTQQIKSIFLIKLFNKNININTKLVVE